jgi:hypothetical protein
MNHLKLLLTFDYELPLGGITKSYDHSLFEPTNKLLDLLKKSKVDAVFYVDILSYIAFKKWDYEKYCIPFEKQVTRMLELGHDVQLHLHPHWLESTFIDGKVVPSNMYKMGDFSYNDASHSISDIVEMGIMELTSMCKKSITDYICIAYRAGGYNFIPCAAEILTSLYNYGIRIDSSISRGYYYKSDVSVVDYRGVPDLPQWYLNMAGDFTKAAGEGEGLLEIPIASKPKGLFEMPTAFKLGKYAHRAVEDRGSMIHNSENVSKPDRLRQMFSSRMLTVDNHTYSHDYLLKILDYNVARFAGKHDTLMMSLIGHPKSLDTYHFELLANFVKRVREKYEDKAEFTTTRNIYDELKLWNV